MNSIKPDTYREILQHGKNKAISSANLAERLGFANVRDLQRSISEAREAGVLILSSSKGGYYLPASDEAGIAEVEEFYRTTKSRALNTLKILKATRRFLNETKGQISLEEMGGYRNEQG